MIRQLKETVSTYLKKPSKNPPLKQDTHILLQLGLQFLIPQGISKSVSYTTAGKEF